ncbi:MAG TPA: hypothetical protein VHD35_01070 [Chitinophagaceae bacterium]|nr:hypothetical protein [Chitinophagaceae bacterium]
MPGDLILHYDADGVTVHHTQVITNITDQAIHIMQGNQNSGFLYAFYHSSDPTSAYYSGTLLQSGYYSLQNGNYHNTSLNETINGLLYGNIGFYRWNFNEFNH